MVSMTAEAREAFLASSREDCVVCWGEFSLEPLRPWIVEAASTARGLLALRVQLPAGQGGRFRRASLRLQLAGLSGSGGDAAANAGVDAARRVLDEFERQLREYLCGSRCDFDLPLDVDHQGTPFQRRVWRELRRIPHGEVITYGELAARLGKPGAARAVGQANGRNPLPLVVPCHRVVASGGRLGGFTGGLEIKRFLLELEGHADLCATTGGHAG